VLVFVTIVYSLSSSEQTGSFCDNRAGGVVVVVYVSVSIVVAIVMCFRENNQRESRRGCS
jgi:hypothetical protein